MVVSRSIVPTGIRSLALLPPHLTEKLRLPLVIVAGLACLATPAQRFERNYPAWVFDEGASVADAGGYVGPRLSYGCADIQAWISKSGKEGMGVSFELQNATRDLCTVEIVYAAFVPEGMTVKPWMMPRRLELTPEELQDAYLGFPFDNEALWNQGRRSGVLHVTFSVQGEIREFRFSLTHKMDGFQRERYTPPRSPARPRSESI